MCDPLSAIAASVALGGGIVQQIGQRQAMRAQERAQERERQRQAALSQEQQGAFEGNLARFDRQTQDKQEGEATAAREKKYQAAVADRPVGNDALAGSGSAPEVIQSSIANALAGATRRAQQSASARAALEGYGDHQLANAIGHQRAGSFIDTIGGMRRGSQAVAPLEVQAAANKGAGTRMLGDLLVLGSQAVGPIGNAAGWFQPTPYGATGAGKMLKSADGRLVGGV